MKLYSPAVIAALCDKHNFRQSKSLGQNFITDQNIISKIIDRSQIGDEDLVLEIGPGIGALTAAAAERAAKVIAIEIDKRLTPVLSDTLRDYKNVDVVIGDVLKTDLNELLDEYWGASKGDGKAVIIGNLPYYITTPVIMKILEGKVAAETLVVMVQKEVADRLVAKPGTKTYGAITVVVNYYCTVARIADVPRDVFVPKPNVDSAVLKLDIRKTPPVSLVDEKVFFTCIKAGFGQRRKTLLNSLSGLGGIGKKEALKSLMDAGIDPTRRAETLSISEFAALANSVSARRE